MILEDAALSALRDAYAADRRVRISGALPAEAARAVHAELAAVEGWTLFAATGAGTAALDRATLAGLGEAGRADLLRTLHAEAAEGRGFAYEGVRLGENAGPPAAERLAASLSSEAVLGRVRAVTGEPVTAASAQATRYRPGHYLTRHRDDPAGETRRVAYVLSLCPRWHPDWGGLLLFFRDDGTPRDAWAPGFASLSLFDVGHVHSVTAIAPFAAAPRLSVTGWFSA